MCHKFGIVASVSGTCFSISCMCHHVCVHALVTTKVKLKPKLSLDLSF